MYSSSIKTANSKASLYYLPIVIAISLTVTGCATNKPFRTSGLKKCDLKEVCGTTFLAAHDKFDLAFIEFTELGNVYNRDRMNRVLDHVRELSKSNEGVTVIVYAHGWKHNASPEDPDIKKFKEMLHTVSKVNSTEDRRLVGIYIGWRGKSLKIKHLDNLTYWGRKEVAQQIGKGGVTELLLQLERITIKNSNSNKNNYFVTGHSLGAAIILSSINEILMDRIIAGKLNENRDCTLSEPFGHGVMLINPAIEANEILQLKELIAESDFLPRATPIDAYH